jgi:hypothetical protein
MVFHMHRRPMMDQQELDSSASRATAALRDELLSLGWPTTAQVDEMLSAETDNATQKRRQGALLGVWADHRHDFVYPLFQFQHGQVNPFTTELLTVLATIPDLAPADDPGGWRRAFWLYGASNMLNGRVPAQVFDTDPQAVIALARAEAAGNCTIAW